MPQPLGPRRCRGRDSSGVHGDSPSTARYVAAPCIANARYPRAGRTRVAPLTLEGPGARSSPELPASGQVSARESEPEEEAFGNSVAHFDRAQSQEDLGACVLLVSPTGQLHKYVIQLAFPREGCTGSTAECDGLLTSLRIAVEMGISPSGAIPSSRPAKQRESSSVC
jgi:hypothetical protein